MKHLILIAALGIAQHVLADVPGFAITQGLKQGTYNLIYQSQEKNDVKLVILDNSNQVIERKIFRSTDGFKLPVNFEDMHYGKYTVKVSDGNHTYQGVIDHKPAAPVSAFHVTELHPSASSRFLLSIVVPEPTTIAFQISDRYGKVIHHGYEKITDQQATVVTIKKHQGPYEFEITDRNGFSRKIVK